MKNIEYVVKQNLCIGCGACEVACPINNCIVIEENIAGFYQAVVDNVKCIQCKKCIQVCPGWDSKTNNINLELPQSYICYSNDDKIRMNGQSGGFIASFLIDLLESKIITGVCVVSMPQNGSLRPLPNIARDKESIILSQGSQYSSVNALKSLKYLRKNDKIAFVGLPCHIQGLCKLIDVGIIKQDQIVVKLGLMCGRIISFNAVNKIITKTTKNKDISYYRYRYKKNTNWPGKFYVKTKQGNEFFVDDGERARLKKLYSHPRCFLCWDKMNTYADIVIGDAWGIQEDPQGVSVVIPQTENGEKIVKAYFQKEISSYSIITNTDKILLGQSIDRRLTEWHYAKKIWEKKFSEINNIDASFNSKYFLNLSKEYLYILENDIKNYYKLNSKTNLLTYSVLMNRIKLTNRIKKLLSYIKRVLWFFVKKINKR